LIARAIKDGADPAKAAEIKRDVQTLTAQFPVYPL